MTHLTIFQSFFLTKLIVFWLISLTVIVKMFIFEQDTKIFVEFKINCTIIYFPKTIPRSWHDSRSDFSSDMLHTGLGRGRTQKYHKHTEFRDQRFKILQRKHYNQEFIICLNCQSINSLH